MIKVFTLNHNGKIELTREELQQLLDEAYQDGKAHCSWITTTPYTYSTTTTPVYNWTETTNSSGQSTYTITCANNNNKISSNDNDVSLTGTIVGDLDTNKIYGVTTETTKL